MTQNNQDPWSVYTTGVFSQTKNEILKQTNKQLTKKKVAKQTKPIEYDQYVCLRCYGKCYFIYILSQKAAYLILSLQVYIWNIWRCFFTASYTFALISVIADDHDDSEDVT